MKEDPIDHLVKAAFDVDPTPSDRLEARLSGPLAEATQLTRRRAMRPILILALAALSFTSVAIYNDLQPKSVSVSFGKYGTLEFINPTGETLVMSPEGKILGSAGSDRIAGGKTIVKLNGRPQEISGLGIHKITDENGAVRFLLDVEPRKLPEKAVDQPKSVSEMIAIQEKVVRSQDNSGVNVLPWLVLGTDPKTKLFWKAEGKIKVVFKTKTTHFTGEVGWPSAGSLASLGLACDYTPKQTPLLNWEVDGVKHQATGYGHIVFTDSKDQEIGTLDIQPIDVKP